MTEVCQMKFVHAHIPFPSVQTIGMNGESPS